jgi:hypothetical protein
MSVNKLDKLEVSGTPKVIGFAIGQAYADSIQIQILQLAEIRERERTRQDSSYLKMLDAAARSVFPEYVLELEGMARSAQVEYETLLVWNCRGDLPLFDDAIPEGCTTLLYPAAKSSVAVIAHNEDGPPELDGHRCWLSFRQENGSKFSTFHYPGMLPGHTLSVNSHGLVQTISNIRVDDLQSGIPHWC